MNKKLLVGAIGVVLVLIVGFVFLFSMPANYKSSIKTNTHTLNVFKSDSEIARIVVFNDLHLFYDYTPEDLDKVVTAINGADPDIVVFNGDLIDNASYQQDKKVNAVIVAKLKELKPLYGKFAILGDQDLKNEDSQNILTASDFEILTNRTRNIRINNKLFNIIGLINNGKQETALKNASDKLYNIAFMHDPRLVDSLLNYKIDIMVTAHTLGGQYNLPLYGSIFSDLKEIPYYKGYQKVNGIGIYNSNGLGIYQSSMRLNAPSTIELFILK